MKCPTCGAENDAANRFCEQCGARIEPGVAAQAAQVDLASQPTAAGPTCPSCGAAVLPGEAFCDECGAALTAAAPVATPAAAAAVSSDAPTMIAPPSAGDGAGSGGGQSVVCAACGHQNLPGDKFCDNCGAALSGQPAATGAAPAGAPAAMSDQALLESLHGGAAATDATIVAPPSGAAPGSPLDAVAISPAPAEAPATPPAQAAPDVAQAEAPTVEQPMVTSSTGGAQDAYEAERKRLQDEIERQDKIIAQFDQMQQMFGAAVPAAVTQGLAEARDARARAETDLNALQPPAPAVDPAEVARIQGEIEKQDKIIAQFEQMQQMFGAATPPAVTQGLAEARDARARAEAELQALTGGAPAATPAPAAPPEPTAAPAQPSDAQAMAAQAQAQLGALGTTPAPSATIPPASQPPVPAETAVSHPAREPAPMPPTSAPAAQPAAAAATPRLVLDDGKELALPADKREIIVGREDPISGIFPEVDLTSYGGETGGVSRQHARINRTDTQWTVTDLNSTNYTRVDGARIEPNVPVPIRNGTRLQFGRVALTFQE